MTQQEFAQKIKAKYPQYQDMPDAELASKMLAKFPQYNESVDSAEPSFSERHPVISGIGSALKEVVAQPNRALQQIGTGIGDYAASKIKLPYAKEIASSLGFTKENAPAIDAAFKNGVEPTKSVEQGVGQALQAGANLATPFVRNPIGMGIQGAVLGAGKAMEEEKSAGDVALSGTVQGLASAALGKILNVSGTLVGQGYDAVKTRAAQSIKPVFEKLAPWFTGASKKELDIAFKQFPELTAGKLKVLTDAASPEDAESILRTEALDKVNSVISKAKGVAEDRFQTAIDAVKNKYPNATGDLARVGRFLNSQLPKFGKPVTADEKMALDSLAAVVKSPREATIDGFRTLLSDTWNIVERTEPGTPARRAATAVWGEARKELSSMTGGTIDPAMTAYSSFKTHQDLLRPAWSSAVNENTARNFVNGLTGSAKTASRDALRALEVMAGVHGKAESAIPELTITRLIRKLGVDQKITGSRLAEIMVAGGLLGSAGVIGEVVGGEKGKTVAQAGAALIFTKALAPSAISNVLLSELKSAGADVSTSAARQWLGRIMQDPKTAQVLLKMLSGGISGYTKSKNEE